MTVVITGASGFLGRHVTEAFARRGRPVVALTRDARRLEARDHVRVVQTDYTTIDLPRASTVVHLAAVRNTPGGKGSELQRVNVEVTERLAEAAVERQVRRFIHIGTALVLGSSRVPLDETAPLTASDDPYIRSKVAGVRALEAMEGLQLVTLLPSIIYGPDHPLARNRITSHMRRLRSQRWRIAVSGPSAPRNLVYVDDVVQAIERAEDDPASSRRVVAGENVMQEELELAVYAALGRRPAPRLVVPRVAVNAAARAADLFIRSEQGWLRRIEALRAPWCFRPSESHVSLAEGIARTIRSL